MAEFVPTPEQREALSAPAPLLILAGAGTGKTTVVTHRIARLISEGLARPGEILALTFAEKAAAEMGDRLATLLESQGMGDAGREVTCRTFHGFGADVVREYAPLLGIDGEFRVLSTPEGWQLLSPVIDGLDFQAIDLPMGGLGGFLNGLLGFFSTAKDHLVGPEELDAFLAAEAGRLASLPSVAAEYQEGRLSRLREVAAAYRAYEGAKVGQGYLDYGDLLLLPVRLLRAHPDVAESFRRRFRYLFVDEYQDTNYSQRTLLMELLSPEARVVVIGDDDQSIYGWRGAVIRNILDFPREPIVADTGPNQRYLTVNRRSGPPILDIANAVISRLDTRYPKKLGYVDGAAPAQVGHYIAASDGSEARWIAETIGRLHGTDEVEDPTGKKTGYGAFAVLCRKRSLFGPMARALEARGIPYELVGGTGFYGRWEVRDVLSYLRVLADPADNLALARVLQSPSWRLSDRDLFHLSEWAQRRTRDRARRNGAPAAGKEDLAFRLIDAVEHHEEVSGLSPDAGPRLAGLKGLLDSMARAQSHLPLAPLVERTIEEAGYRRELASRPDFDSHLALLNLGKLVELARAFEGGGEGLDAFVEYVGYALDSGGEEAEVLAVDEASDAVKVMTVHQSKGLEFPVVFIPGLAARLFPDPRLDDPDRWDQFPEELKAAPEPSAILALSAIGDRKQMKAALEDRKEFLKARGLDEERRLFYVAVTRAQRALYLSRAWWYGSNTKPRDPSVFWEELLETGLSRPMGEEEAPALNPNLQGGAGSGKERPGDPSGNLSRLLLDPARAAAWVESAASQRPGEWAAARSEVDALLSAIAAPVDVGQRTAPAVQLSCSGLIQYARCPRLYRYCYLDCLPQRPAPWAAVGTEVHRLIEEMSRVRRAAVPEVEGADPEPDPDEREHAHHHGHGPGVKELLEVYRRSPFAGRPATMVEEPFLLPLDGNLLRGRVDRLDRLEGGARDLVDFKASRFPGRLLERQRQQMALYALAAWRLWDVDPGRLSCHILFLVDGHQAQLAFSRADLESAEAWAGEQLRSVRAGRFPRASDPQACQGCDYGHLC